MMVRTLMCAALGVLLLAGPAFAVDGVIEINQARALAGGVTATDTAGYPVTIDAPGSYRLTSDLIVTEFLVNGINVDSDDVNLDLNGFKIGTGTEADFGISGSGVSRVVISNGTVEGTFLGVVISLSGGSSNRIERVTVSETLGFSGGVSCSSSCHVVGCRVAANLSGISVGSGSIVEDNRVLCGECSTGINAGSRSVVADNVVEASTGDPSNQVGIDAGAHSVVRSNTVNSAAFGIRCSNCTVTGNAVLATGQFGLDSAGTATGYGQNQFVGPSPNVSAGALQIGPNVCGGNLTCP